MWLNESILKIVQKHRASRILKGESINLNSEEKEAINTETYLGIKKSVTDSELSIKIFKKKASDSLFWNVKIKYENSIIFESGYVQDDILTVPLCNTGRFIIFVQAKLNRKTLPHFRTSIWYYSDQERLAYQKFFSEFQKKEEEELPLFHLPYPYQNIAAVFSKEKTAKERLETALKKISPKLTMDIVSHGNNGIYLISEHSSCIRNSEVVAFSGKSKYHGKFIYGQADIPETVNLPELSEEIGYFSLFRGSKKRFEITNDYFGTYPLYIYETAETSIVSNSFHLLALLAKRLGLTLTLDIDCILPYFVTGERMLFEQLASHHSFVKEIKKLPIHSMCVFSPSTGLKLKNKAIGELMRCKIPFDESKYRILLKKSAREIIENIDIILNDERITSIVTDVSGGKDSRVVLGALLNCNTSNKNVYVYSKDVPQKNDKPAFIPLNHVHNFPYDTEAEKYVQDDIQRKWLERRSFCLGTLFDYGIPWNLTAVREQPLERIRLTGAGGDMLLCPYFPMSFQNISYQSIADMAKTLSLHYNNGLVDFEKIHSFVQTVIEQGLSEVEGTSPKDVFNNYYLYFRNVYHFGPEVLISILDTQEEKWAPLYSKTAFQIRQMTAHTYNGIKVAIDLLQELAPVLLNVPFNSKEYNNELSQLLKSDSKLKDSLCKKPVRIDLDETEWKEAQKQKLSNRVVTKSNEISRQNQEMIDTIYETIIYRLNKIIHYDSKLAELIGLDLYTFIEKNKEQMKNRPLSRDIVFIYNKITTVSDLIEIIGS